jgi:hypothetical protein
MPQEVDGRWEQSSFSIQKLRARPRTRYGNVIWPEGTPQRLTKEIADHFFSLMATSDCPLAQLLRDHPELPPFKQLDSWRNNNKNGFGDRWRQARAAQGEFLAQMALGLQKNAHVVRVRFDILRWLAAKFHPSVYAEKPSTAPVQTVNVGIAVSQHLAELRSQLDQTRAALKAPTQKRRHRSKEKERAHAKS